MQLFDFIKKQTQLSEKSVQNTIKLLQEDCTIPFIARYRKEMTGNLDEVQIEEILKAKNYYEELVKRKTSILTSIEEQGALTADLKAKIEAAESIILLEDLYLPYKKKRKTKADQAREEGLEPLAKIIMAQNAHNLQQIAQNYRTDKVKDASEALAGARLIIAEWISERSDIRDYMRNQFHNFSIITSSVVKTKIDDKKAQKFKDYFDWSESLKKIPSHRFLAIQRAETEGFIRIKLKVDKERILQHIERKIIRSSGESAEQIELAIADSYQDRHRSDLAPDPQATRELEDPGNTRR